MQFPSHQDAPSVADAYRVYRYVCRISSQADRTVVDRVSRQFIAPSISIIGCTERHAPTVFDYNPSDSFTAAQQSPDEVAEEEQQGSEAERAGEEA